MDERLSSLPSSSDADVLSGPHESSALSFQISVTPTVSDPALVFALRVEMLSVSFLFILNYFGSPHQISNSYEQRP